MQAWAHAFDTASAQRTHVLDDTLDANACLHVAEHALVRADESACLGSIVTT